MKKLTLKIAFLTVFSSLTACQAENIQHLPTTTTLPSLQKVNLTTNNIHQIAVDDKHLYVINNKGELWQNNQKLSDNFSIDFLPIAYNGKFASANRQGFLTIWQNQQLYQSDILLSPHSGLAWHGDCVIAIAKTPKSHPIRACILNDKLTIQAKRPDIETLPDARPIVWQNKVAILANPDNKTYRHGVLGDDLEARSLYVLSSNTLADAFSPIHLNQQVFEHNQVQIQNNQLATVVSGGGNGAKVVLFDSETGQKIAESKPLPSNRWQSPFAFNGQWYGVKMPHILGTLVRYSINNKQLSEKILGEAVSNHIMGSYDTQLAVNVADKMLIPNISYRQISLLDHQENLQELSPILPARIVRGVSIGNKSFWLLSNGDVWSW